jgi:hypothetical protein
VHHRVAQLERDYGDLLGMLPGSQHTLSPETTNATRPSPQPVSASLESDTGSSLHPTSRQISDDCIDQGLISLGEAEDLLSSYRRMSQNHFPYVLLLDDISLSQLRRDRPVLLIAILTVSSWKNRPRQLILEELLLKDFGTSFFFDCEKRFEILQALLVYLAWCVLPLQH